MKTQVKLVSNSLQIVCWIDSNDVQTKFKVKLKSYPDIWWKITEVYESKTDSSLQSMHNIIFESIQDGKFSGIYTG